MKRFLAVLLLLFTLIQTGYALDIPDTTMVQAPLQPGNHLDNLPGNESNLSVLPADVQVFDLAVQYCGFQNDMRNIWMIGDTAIIRFLHSIQIVDCSDASAPALMGELYIGGDISAGDMLYDGATLWYAQVGKPDLAIDLTDLRDPKIADTIAAPSFPLIFARHDQFLYCHTSPSMMILDATNPYNLSQVGSWQMVDSLGANMLASDMSSDRGFLWICPQKGRSLQVADLKDPMNPVVVGQSNMSTRAHSISVADSLALLCTQTSSGMLLFNTSNPQAPTLICSIPTPSWPLYANLEGDRIYAMDYDSGLQVIDIADPGAPVLLGKMPLNRMAKVDVKGDTLYTVLNGSGLEIFDLTTPAAPILIGQFGKFRPQDVSISGQIAYICDRQYGIVVLTTNATHPDTLGIMSYPGFSRINSLGPYLYLWNVDSNLVRVVNATNPDAPIDGPVNLGSRIRDIKIVGSSLYAFDSDFGLRSFSITNPMVPLLQWALPIGSSIDCHAMDADGRCVVLGMTDSVLVVDLLGGSGAEIVSVFHPPWFQSSGKLLLDGTRVFATESYGGLYYFDISSLALPVQEGYTHFHYSWTMLTSFNKYLFASSYGVPVLEMSGDYVYQIGGINENYVSNARIAVNDSTVFVVHSGSVRIASWQGCCSGQRGNVNGSGGVDLSDLSILISYLTQAVRPVLPCLGEANLNGNGGVDLSDLAFLISYLTVKPAPSLLNCW